MATEKTARKPRPFDEERATELMAAPDAEEQGCFRDFLIDAVALNYKRDGTLANSTPANVLLSALLMITGELGRRCEDGEIKVVEGPEPEPKRGSRP